jgi:calcium-dependent protein kinase
MALNYMHLNKIVHRDIKPENVLIENLVNLEIKLTDFGFATYFDQKNELNEVLGSPLYMPPEIVSHKSYDSKVDIWSAGIMTYVLLIGKPPFLGKTKSEVYSAIKEKPLTIDEKDWAPIS